MIIYSKTCWGIHLLSRWHGSAFPRVLPFSLLSAAITAVLHVYILPYDEASWRHPFPYDIIVFIVGFAIVFRSNLGYARFWDGRTFLQQMTARWADACTQAVIFHTAPLEQEVADEESYQEQQAAIAHRNRVIHLMSLMHAVALQVIRGDLDLRNLHPRQRGMPPPAVDSAALTFDNGRKGVFGLGVFDLFVLRSSEQKRAMYNRAMPLAVVGGVPEAEALALGINQALLDDLESAPNGAPSEASVRPECCAAFFGLSTGMYAPGCAERVNVVYAWLLRELERRTTAGGMIIPAPIAANLYHMLSEGYLGFEMCRKLQDTPFPFPWSQMILIFLIAYALTAPILIVAYVPRLWLAVLIDFLSVQMYWSLNEVVRDVEDPFVYEPNDLPIARYQYEFNERIVAAGMTHAPAPTPILDTNPQKQNGASIKSDSTLAQNKPAEHRVNL